MNAKQLFFRLIAILSLSIIGIAGSAYGITNLLASRSAQLASSKAKVEQLNLQEGGITKSKRDIATYSELNAIAKKIVPQDKDQAEAVRQIVNIASASGVTLKTISFANSSLGTTKSSASSKLSQLTPVANIPGVYNLQITLSNGDDKSVTFNQFNNFLRGLENNRRTAIVSSLNIQPKQDNPNQITFTLIINTYIKPS